MTWTAEQEAAWQRAGRREINRDRIVHLTKLRNHFEAACNSMDESHPLSSYLRDHGAELIELIRPFVWAK